MNFATSERAVSMFPYATLVARKLFTTRRQRAKSTGRLREWAGKYTDRGFQVIDGECGQVHTELGLGDRQVMDWKSWIIDFIPVGKCLAF